MDDAIKLLKEHGPCATAYLSRHFSRRSAHELAYIYREDPRCVVVNGSAECSRKVWRFKGNGKTYEIEGGKNETQRR